MASTTNHDQPAQIRTLRRILLVDWSVVFWTVSFLLICVTGLNFHLPQFDGGIFQLEDRALGWRLLEPFNLARENNFAAWWSGACLATAGLLAFQQANRLRTGPFGREFCFILSALLVALASDEVGSIHERIGSMRNLAPYGAVAIVALAYATMKAWSDRGSRRYLLMIIGGFCVFASVAVQEVLEHAIAWPPWSVGLRFAVEEGTELLGMYLILRAFIHSDPHHESQRNEQNHSDPRRSIAWADALPRPTQFPSVWWLLIVGLLLHAVVSITVLPAYDDLITRGNTATVFPFLVYLLLAFGYRERIVLNGGGRLRDWLFFACLVVCSLDSVAAFSQYVPKVMGGITDVLPARLFETTGCGRYFVHLALLSALVFSLGIHGRQKLRFLGLLAVALVGCLAESVPAQLALPGFLVFGLAALLIASNQHIAASKQSSRPPSFGQSEVSETSQPKR